MSDFLEDIDNYLDGEMTIEEQTAFETKIASDPELSEAVKLQKDMRVMYDDHSWIEGDKKILQQDKAQQLQSFFGSEEAHAIQNTIAEVVSENREKSGTSNTFWWIGIAASIAVLIAISTFVFRSNNYEELYAQYLEVESIPSLVTRGEEKEQLLQNAQLLFEDQKYDKAVIAFEQYQNTSGSVNPLSYIYTGISYIETNKFQKAIAQFELLKASNTLQSKKANWYIAMTYLKQGKERKLKEILQHILSDSTHYKYKEASELLDAID